MHDEKNGLVPGRVMAIDEDRKGSVWVSSLAGLSRFQNGHFTTLTTVNGPFAGVVPTLVEDNDGYIWVGVNAGSGLMRLNPAEIDKVATNSSHEVEYRLYDVSDGLPGDLQWTSRPAAVRARRRPPLAGHARRARRSSIRSSCRASTGPRRPASIAWSSMDGRCPRSATSNCPPAPRPCRWTTAR